MFLCHNLLKFSPRWTIFVKGWPASVTPTFLLQIHDMHLVVNIASYNTKPNKEYYFYLYPLTRAFVFVLSNPAKMSTKMPKSLWHLRLYFGVNCGTLLVERCQFFYVCKNWPDIHERYLISFFYLFTKAMHEKKNWLVKNRSFSRMLTQHLTEYFVVGFKHFI